MPTSAGLERLLLVMAAAPTHSRDPSRAEDKADDGVSSFGNTGSTPRCGDAVAASGTTPFTVAACGKPRLRRADIGLPTIAERRSCGIGSSDLARYRSEPIAGSTRLVAGTAQKITLNLLSSLLMILLGRVYGGLMVDLQASNEKLLRRSEDMLIRLTHCSRDQARDALGRARGSVKIAVMLLSGCDLERAKALLDRANGQLRKALTLIGQRGMDAA